MMEERLKEIKRIFKNYERNVAHLRQIERPSITGISYDKIAVKTDKSRNSVEQLMITYLIDKEKLEKEIALVDKVYEHFADDRDEELARLIDLRFRQGKKHWQATNGVYISDRQGLNWLKKAYEKAEIFAIQMHIFE